MDHYCEQVSKQSQLSEKAREPSGWALIAASGYASESAPRSISAPGCPGLPDLQLFSSSEPVDASLATRATQRQSSEQLHNEQQLSGPEGATENLLTDKFSLEGDAKRSAYQRTAPLVNVDAQTNGAMGSSIKIDLTKPIAPGEQVVLSQPIDYQFHAVTELQKQFQKDHPNIDLGHIVHVHFRAKADNENQMTLEIMGNKPPYEQSMSERIALGKSGSSPDGKKDADGFTTYDFYAVVPSTTNASGLDLKLKFGSAQPKGTIDIENLSVQEVTSAPGIVPANVIRSFEGATPERQAGSFMLGANANHLIDANTRMPENVLDAAVKKAQADHPGDLKDQLKEIAAARVDYIRANKFTEAQKDEYMRELSQLGVNTVTIPVYWNQIEGQQGKPDYSQVDDLIKLADKYHMKVKLHPIVWADCYPDWLEKAYQQAKQKNPELTEDQYTQNVVQTHIKQTLDHFGEKFGSEIAYVEVNEMNSTELLEHPKTDVYGREVLNQHGQPVMEQVHNGLTGWIKDAGPVAVINQVDAWIHQDLADTKGLQKTKHLENEYYVDNQTEANDIQVSQDANHPDAFGIEAHQFSGADPSLNENLPLLGIYQKLQMRQPNGVDNYISELTVETTAAPGFDETNMSPEVRSAAQSLAIYRSEHHLPQLSNGERKAEEAQAEELLAWYKTAAANPNTAGVTLWDGSVKNSWLQNTGGVLDSNLDPKISYFALQEFIQQLGKTSR